MFLQLLYLIYVVSGDAKMRNPSHDVQSMYCDVLSMDVLVQLLEAGYDLCLCPASCVSVLRTALC